MTVFTEQAIRDVFIGLLEEKPLNKITVRELSERCGINRNTFYYHFHDVYELLDWLFKTEEQRLLANKDSISTLEEGLTAATRFALENRVAISHIYMSVNRDMLLAYLLNAARICLAPYIDSQCAGLAVGAEDKETLLFLYAGMVQGAIVNVLRDTTFRDPEQLVRSACRMLDGTVRLALENAAHDA